MITLRFVSHPGIFNWACSMLAQNGFRKTHVEYKRKSDGYYIGAMGDGVKARPPNYDAGIFTSETFVDVEVTPEQEAIFEAFLESQIGKPYDYLAVLSFFWPSRNWQEYDHWDCAELMGEGLGECGFLPKEMLVQYSRLTVLGIYLLITSRTISMRTEGE